MTAKSTEPAKGEQLQLVEAGGKRVSTVETDTAADVKELRALGRAAMDAAVHALDCYMRLVEFVRIKQIAPTTLSRELKALGFRDSRISEVKAIAYTSDAVFKEITEGKLGFKVAYERAKKAKRRAAARQQELSAEAEFAAMLTAALEQLVPVAGKVPAWMRAQSLTVNGCVVGITVRRARETESK